ncbi:Rieske 2Fe-2S domain-containing protein [Pontixanthobacter aestiaquae]|uniref:Rieske 2Fe-2S domain-containing protein n=1 Tax=Pontixanthobacter aestiaquae TaxID=1509367 RepID=A0A844Z5E4_9SPHN|nr:Rieske 2Fe-2S domain-containing protein [Pontixanthobacter aestiaquae]MDN3646295.1 Rieske 2Fe-2S domain-containing protein [Pontixanthobacter aestiaquae]MXO82714.1 Rieske 2Fe-2S domain-containing protein [Pontixanthobacter aestiaquae]
MMENAYDWEHLPFVHPSSFAHIELIDEGEWGWRCKTTLPPAAGGGEQVVELLVDRPNHYWATTVMEGTGEGVQIHTQATQKSADDPRAIEVDVRFYLPQAPETEEQASMILGYLQAQYKMLYDEDEALMSARQDALDKRKEARKAAPETADLGPETELDRGMSHPVELSSGRFVVRHHKGEWITHAAMCPHMLGPLGDADISKDGTITCPWHAYRFDLADGAEQEGRCGALPSPPVIRLVDGHLFIGE